MLSTNKNFSLLCLRLIIIHLVSDFRCKRTKENSCKTCLNLWMQNRPFFFKYVHLRVIIIRSTITSASPPGSSIGINYAAGDITIFKAPNIDYNTNRDGTKSTDMCHLNIELYQLLHYYAANKDNLIFSHSNINRIRHKCIPIAKTMQKGTLFLAICPAVLVMFFLISRFTTFNAGNRLVPFTGPFACC